MLDLKALEKDPEGFEKKLGRRGAIPGLRELLELSGQRKSLIAQMQSEQVRRNAASKALSKGNKDEIESQRAALKELAQSIKANQAQLREIEAQLDEAASVIPNVPRDDVPDGDAEADNVEIRKVLEPKTFDFKVKDHVDLGESLGVLDFARAAKISGARFAFLKGAVCQLNRALLNFFTNYHVALGDTELTAPYMVKEDAMRGTGQFPKFVEDAFKVGHGDHDLFLIPTAEVPLTNYYADEILEESQLPLRLCAYSACFRAEAGAAGRDTRGLIRQHQFEKVEMVRFATPEQADDELEAMVTRASDLLTKLELPHRVVVLCAGDLGFTAEKTYDIEVWLPGQECYREISSCSVFGTFQSRRAKIRYRMKGEGSKPGKAEPLVTLNGSGLPLGRTLVAILENHQNADGSVSVPEALWPYMNGTKVIRG